MNTKRPSLWDFLWMLLIACVFWAIARMAAEGSL